MCDCIKNIKDKFKDLYPDAEYISFENVEMMSGRVYSTLNIKLPNKKKPQEQLLLHSHCPMCGEKYETK